MNKMNAQNSLGQAGMGGNFKNEQIEALLMQNSMLGQQNQGAFLNSIYNHSLHLRHAIPDAKL
jgi:hypothetical protein